MAKKSRTIRQRGPMKYSLLKGKLVPRAEALKANHLKDGKSSKKPTKAPKPSAEEVAAQEAAETERVKLKAEAGEKLTKAEQAVEDARLEAEAKSL